MPHVDEESGDSDQAINIVSLQVSEHLTSDVSPETILDFWEVNPAPDI